jgi:hypothetical protein
MSMGQMLKVVTQGPTALMPMAQSVAPNSMRLLVMLPVAQAATVRASTLAQGISRAMALGAAGGGDTSDANMVAMAQALAGLESTVADLRTLLAVDGAKLGAGDLLRAYGVPA